MSIVLAPAQMFCASGAKISGRKLRLVASRLACWRCGRSSWRIPAYLLPGPLDVAQSLAWLLGTPAGLVQVGASLLHVGLSMLLAFVAGAAVALTPYYVGWLRPAIDSRLTPFLNSFPGIGWTLLAIIWLGLG